MIGRNVGVMLVFMVIAVAGLGATLRVPGDFPTIQAAIDQAASGDVILIAAGIYEESFTIAKDNLTIRGDVEITPPEVVECCGSEIFDVLSTVTIRGQITILNADNLTIEGLTVTGFGFGIYVQGNMIDPVKNLVVRYCNVSRNWKSGIQMVGHYMDISILCSIVSYNNFDGIVVGDWGSGVTVEGCDVSHNGQRSLTGVGIRVGAHVKAVEIRHNCIVGNAFAGIHPG